MKSKKTGLALLFILVIISFTTLASGQSLRLPKIFSDNMVLQQQLPVVVWGWAESGEKVTVKFGRQKKQLKQVARGNGV